MILPMFSCFSDLLSSLSKLAHSRLPDALATSTQRAYLTMFHLYLAFLAFIGFLPAKVNVDVILAFLECLNFNSISVAQMSNHLAAIKSFSVKLNLPVNIFEHSKISMYLKAIQKTTPVKIKLNNIVDIPFLTALVKKCDSTYMGQIFKVAYLISFFGFLRLSNLAPHSMAAFSFLKHLAKGDVIFSNSGVILLIKWSKTLQIQNQAKL